MILCWTVLTFSLFLKLLNLIVFTWLCHLYFADETSGSHLGKAEMRKMLFQSNGGRNGEKTVESSSCQMKVSSDWGASLSSSNQTGQKLQEGSSPSRLTALTVWCLSCACLTSSSSLSCSACSELRPSTAASRSPASCRTKPLKNTPTSFIASTWEEEPMKMIRTMRFSAGARAGRQNADIDRPCPPELAASPLWLSGRLWAAGQPTAPSESETPGRPPCPADAPPTDTNTKLSNVFSTHDAKSLRETDAVHQTAARRGSVLTSSCIRLSLSCAHSASCCCTLSRQRPTPSATSFPTPPAKDSMVVRAPFSATWFITSKPSAQEKGRRGRIRESDTFIYPETVKYESTFAIPLHSFCSSVSSAANLSRYSNSCVVMTSACS